MKHSRLQNARRTARALAALIFLLAIGPSPFLFGQQPQTSTAPIYDANAKYTQGVGPGYWPTAASGLTLNLAPGTADCNGSIVTYAGGTLTMTAGATNYVYLDPASSCAPASNTTGFTSGVLPVAQVVTSSSAISSIMDDRTWFLWTSSNAGAAGDLSNLASPTAINDTTMTFAGAGGLTAGGTNQSLTLTPSGTGTVLAGTINYVCNAVAMPGADAGAKIAACLPNSGVAGSLPLTGGVIDLTGFQGAQSLNSIAATVDISWPIQFRLGSATFTYSGPALANGLFRFKSGSDGSSIVGVGKLGYSGGSGGPSIMDVAPSTGPMPVINIGTSSTTNDNVMSLRFEHFTIEASANVSDIVKATGMAKGLYWNDMSAIGPGGGSYTSGYAFDFTSTYSTGDDSPHYVYNSEFLFLHSGLHQSSANPSEVVIGNHFDDFAADGLDITQSGATLIAEDWFQGTNETVAGKAVSITNAGPVTLLSDHFERNGSQAANVDVYSDGSVEVVVQGCNFASAATPVDKIGVQFTGANYGAVRDNKFNSLAMAAVDLTGATSGNVEWTGNFVSGTEFLSGNYSTVSFLADPAYAPASGIAYEFNASSNGLTETRFLNTNTGASRRSDILIGTGATPENITLGVDQSGAFGAGNNAYLNNNSGGAFVIAHSGTVGWKLDSSGNETVTGAIAPSGNAATWTSGAGAPSGSCTTGSLYTNTSGGAGTTLYVCESGSWAAK